MLLVSLVAHLFRFVTVLIINCSMAEKHWYKLSCSSVHIVNCFNKQMLNGR
jgi:hypothetical protein